VSGRCGRLPGTRPSAAIAGLLWALHPGVVAYDATLMSESLLSFSVAVTFFLATRARSRRAFVLAAAAAGLAALVRPFGVFLVVPVLILALARVDRRWLTATVVCATAAVPVLGWSARNAAVGEGFRLCTVTDVTTYYFAHYVGAEERGEDGHKSWPAAFTTRTRALETSVAPGEDCHAGAGRMARAEIAATGPKLVARVLAKSQLKLWVSHSLGDALRPLGIEYKPSGLVGVLVLNEPGEPAVRPQTVLALLWVALNTFILGWLIVAFVRVVRRRL
jgi:4-amino-4-deoxy-L-arabinose transferase-like glycosyltransferase